MLLSAFSMAAWLVIAALPAQAAITCTFVGTTVSLDMSAAGDAATLSASASGAILFNGVQCSSASLAVATDIDVTGGSANQTLTIELNNDFDTSAEDWSIALGLGADALVINGDPDAADDDNVHLGDDPAIDFDDNGVSDVTTLTGVETITLNGGDGDDELDAGGNATVGGDFNSALTINGGLGADDVEGGAAIDIINGGDGDDSLEGGVGNDTINGEVGNDSIDGDAGNDIINGGVGNDELDGDSCDCIGGDDTISGGDGDDDIQGDNVADGNPGGDDIINADAGNDEVEGDSLDGALGGDDVINGGAGNDELEGDGMNSGTPDPSGGNDVINGGDGDDEIDGDSVDGVGGNDTLNGDAGNDEIQGDSITSTAGTGGNDIINGGTGNDRFLEDQDCSSVTAICDTVNGADTFAGGDGVDKIIFDDRDAATDGSGVRITLDGVADDGGILLAEGDNIAADVEDADGSEGADIFVGSASANEFEGDDGIDTASGGAGDDELDGDDGNDTLNGGDGGDALDGGSGDDTLNGDAGADTFDEGTGPSGADVMSGGADTDTVDYSERGGAVSVTIDDVANDGEAGEGDNVKTTGVENVITGSGPDTVVGSAANNVIDTNDGADTANGAAGDDTFDERADTVGSEANGDDDLTGGDGIDWVDYSNRTCDLAISLDDVEDDGQQVAAAAPCGVAEDDNVRADVENVRSGSGDDVLVGSVSVNTIFDGRGADDVSGDAGNDTFVQAGGSSAGDEMDTLSGGGGKDWVDYSARLGTVNVTLDGVGNDGVPAPTPFFAGEFDNVLPDTENVRGTAFSDRITGSAGPNTFEGGGGADRLTGGAGRDRLFGQGGPDNLSGGGGNDLLNGGKGRDRGNGGAGNDRCVSVEVRRSC